MKLRKTFAALALAAVLPVAVACGTAAAEQTATDTTITSTTGSATAGVSAADDSRPDGAGPGGAGPGGVEVDSVTTQEDLVALVQEAYGDAGLDLHRGHQPVQDVLDQVLAITHDELHVRMDAGQNLATVATDIGVDPQTLVDALVAAWSPAIENVLAAGEITEAEAEEYRQALEDAFTFRVTWNGEDATPTFAGLSA